MAAKTSTETIDKICSENSVAKSTGELDYTNLSKLAHYILTKRGKEAGLRYIHTAREIKLPFLKEAKEEEKILELFKNNAFQFLEHIVHHILIKEETEALRRWQNGFAKSVADNEIKESDIILLYSVHKRVLNSFLADFSKDANLLVAIVQEIENLFSYLELKAHQVNNKLQKTELVRLNMKLQEYQEELQVANEELRESHEELLVTNEDLREQIKGRENAEENLARERNYLEAILEHISDGIVACNSQGELTFFNSTTLELHGLPALKISPDKWAGHYSLYHEDGTTLMDTEDIPLFRAFRGEKVKDQKMVIVPKNGDAKSLLATGQQIKNSEGEVLGAVVAMRDVTLEREARRLLQAANAKLEEAKTHLQDTNLELERRVQLRTDELSASEEELRQSLENAVELNKTLEERENFLASIIEQTPVSTWISDEKGTQIQVNEACLKLMGVSNAELGVGKYNILEDNTLADKPFYKNIEEVYTKGKATTFETAYDLSRVSHLEQSKSKSVYLKVTIFPIKDYTGKVTNAIIQHEDISERKKAEKALKESESLFRTIANASPVGLWMTDIEGNNNFVNKTWVLWTGQPAKSHHGQGWLASLNEADQHTVRKQFKRDFDRRDEFSAEFKMTDALGDLCWCLIEGVPRYHTDATFAGYVGSIADITERKQVEQLLKDKNVELEKINSDLDSFIYTASHDLKSPIASIEGLAGILERKLEDRMDDKERQVMDMIGQSISRFRKTINGLTDITKVQKDLNSESEQLSFNEVLDDVLEDVNELLVEAKGTLEPDFKHTEVQFARGGLRSIIYNLVSNAIKYRDPERPLLVNICTYQENGETVLSVEDNGLGIAKADQDKLFTMFKRLHSHVEGTGIGLYMIKRIIENKGGRIKVESTEGEGTCFRVFFPKK